MIKIDNLGYSYPQADKKALDGINLKIKKGNFVSVIGHNGSGKSTLVQVLNGLLIPAEGKVSVDGISTTDTQQLHQLRKIIQITFQNPDNQIVGNTVEREIAFGPENIGLPRQEIQNRTNDALNVTDLGPYRLFEPHNLSGGQKQRLALASVMAMKPDYLVLDEPASMLDAASSQSTFGFIKNLNKKEGITVIFTTHWLEAALLADRIILLNEGKISLDFKKEELSQNLSKLHSSGVSLPFWAALAFNLQQRGYEAGRYWDEQSFREWLCTKLKT